MMELDVSVHFKQRMRAGVSSSYNWEGKPPAGVFMIT